MYCCRILSLLFIISAFHNHESEGVPVAVVAKPRQFLPPIPGYIPVYIRAGDQPLEDINLELAEAFKSYSQKHARFNSIRGRSQNIVEADDKHRSSAGTDDKLELTKTLHPAAIAAKPTISFGLDDFGLDDLEENINNIKQQLDHKTVVEITTKTPQHIQKIPKS